MWKRESRVTIHTTLFESERVEKGFESLLVVNLNFELPLSRQPFLWRLV